MKKSGPIFFLLALNICFAVFLFAAETVEVPINPPRKLDGASKQDILSLRRQYINKVPALAPKNYEPNMDVFGQIQDGKPWWGLLGICYYGNGYNSILGRSKESRFIINPYLLIGVEELNAHILRPIPVDAREFYPTPTSLVWSKDASNAKVTYDIETYYQKASEYSFPETHSLYLSDYNARDFGFTYFAIDLSESGNVTAAFNKIIPIVQFIHTGSSCGYPGGCNNKSPSEADLEIQWRELPAKIYIKLWKNQPAKVEQKADMIFILELI